jgi:biopolymer transport protein ExbB
MEFSLSHIWASMGAMSKLVALTLVIMAIASIGVLVERLVVLSKGRAATLRFVRAAAPSLERWDLDGVRVAADAHARSWAARLIGAATRKFQAAARDEDGGVAPVELARREAERGKEGLVAELKRGLPVLATVGSIAPFVGLLGTVVGIISAFQGIAATGSGGLGAVSAGIAEALVVTALGLFVAIPSVLCFNYLTTQIASIERTLDRAIGELLDEMENQHGRKSDKVVRRAA